MKQLKKRLSHYYRVATAPLRRLPDFIIIGAQKSGTSSLYALLSQHPQLTLSRRKEVHYFDWHFDKSLDWYKTWFPINVGKLTGEATPIYMFHPEIAKRIKKTLATDKFIVILRNPVDRAYAHYNMVCQKGFEDLSFEEALEAEDERIQVGLEEIKDSNFSLTYQRYSYVHRGYYAEQLKRWREFHKEESIHIVFYEELIKYPSDVYNGICKFLNIETVNDVELPHYNAHAYPDMHGDTRKMLTQRFTQPNNELENFLGREVPWSKT